MSEAGILIQRAWQKAQDAWVSAGKGTPCFDPDYMAAREELANTIKRAEQRAAKRRKIAT